VPGRPPGHRHASGAWRAAAEQCSTQNDQGLPTPRAGSEYEDDLRAYGADRYVPTEAERYASNKGELAPTEEKLCDMSGANFERPAPAQRPPPLQSAKLRLNSLTGLPRAQLDGLLCIQAEDEFTALAEQLATMKAKADAAQAFLFTQLSNLMAETKQMCSMFELLISRLPAATPAPPPATPAATPTPHQQDIAHAKQRFDEKAAFDAAVEAAVARINANASHAAHGAATSTRPRAQG